ncbi:MAG: hypothetical protein QM657_03600 [Lacrimispora sp.]|uniref:hypothetical protein n=1 Tax=Lacrimispora sp. TaxID=2719234 RepID=UPI0039E70E15
MMQDQNLKERFVKKIRDNYENFLRDWLTQDAEELVSDAEEIAAVKTLYNILPDIASSDDMGYLLRFENPLEVVRDGWLAFNNTDLSDELIHVLWFISKNPSIWEDYKMAEDSDLREGQNVILC